MNILRQLSAFFTLALVFGIVTLAGMAYFEPSQAAARAKLAALDVQQATAAAEVQRTLSAQEAAIQAEQVRAMAPLQLGLSVFWLLLLPLVVVVAVAVVVDAYRLRRVPLVRANDAGLLPVARATLESNSAPALALLAAFQQERLTRAAIPSRISVRGNSEALAAPEVTIEPGQGLPIAPSLLALWEQGFRPTSDRLLLGYGASGAIYGSVDDLLSVLLIGRPGTGKSTFLRLIVAQLAYIGAQIGILDPHGSISDDCPIPATWKAEEAKDFDRVAAALASELDQRLTQRRAGKRDFIPALILCDEWNLLSEMSPDATATLKRVIQEGRKVAMFAIIAGQGAPAASFGGSVARDNMSSRVIFNSEQRQCTMAGLPLGAVKALLPILASAGKGHAILHRSTCDAEVVSIPNCKPSDLLLFQNHASATSQTGREAPAAGPLPQVVNGSAKRLDMEAEQEAPAMDPRAEQVRALLKEGRGTTEIVKELWGVSGGRAFQVASQELRAIIAALV